MRGLMSARAACTIALFAASLFATRSFAQVVQKTSQFHGVKVNSGTVTHSKEGDRNILTLSDDFQVPDVPDAHWQVIDSKGNVYTLGRLQAKNDKFNRSITLPAYIPDVAKVQIWCAFAETLLGEASFSSPVM